MSFRVVGLRVYRVLGLGVGMWGLAPAVTGTASAADCRPLPAALSASSGATSAPEATGGASASAAATSAAARDTRPRLRPPLRTPSPPPVSSRRRLWGTRFAFACSSPCLLRSRLLSCRSWRQCRRDVPGSIESRWRRGAPRRPTRRAFSACSRRRGGGMCTRYSGRREGRYEARIRRRRVL